MPRPRGQATRDRLLAAAAPLFAAHGKEGVSLRDLAKKARVNSALVAYHFGDKHGLFVAVIEAALADLVPTLCAAAASGAPEAHAREVLAAYADYLAAHEDVARLIARAVLDADRAVLDLLGRRLQPLVTLVLPPGEAPEADGPLMHALTLFGAAVVPYIYAPLLRRLGVEPRAPAFSAARRSHLEAAAARLLEPPPARRKLRS